MANGIILPLSFFKYLDNNWEYFVARKSQLLNVLV